MDSNKLEELLNKYWNCETSLEEEQQLRKYFQEEGIPEQWKETGSLFRYFESQKKKSLKEEATFDDRIVRQIKDHKRNTPPRFLYSTMRIAAGIAVLVIAIWFVRSEVRKTTPKQMVDTYEDPKLAFEETKKALLMISRSFGKAEEQAKKINLFNEAQQEIKRKEKETKL